jgi:hypothetical protein
MARADLRSPPPGPITVNAVEGETHGRGGGASCGNACCSCSRRVRGKWPRAISSIWFRAALASSQDERAVIGDGNCVLGVCAS